MKMAIGTPRYDKQGKYVTMEPGSEKTGNTILIVGADNVQFTVIKSWNKMTWDKKNQHLKGIADLELLERLSSLVRLPSAVEDRRNRLRAVQDAVDRERVNQEPIPFYKYPVKLPLYAHQVKAANMALITFGWVPPENQTHDRSVRA